MRDNSSSFWLGVAVALLTMILLLIISSCDMRKEIGECKASGYSDAEHEDDVTYCIRAEGNVLVGRSLEAIRVEGREQYE